MMSYSSSFIYKFKDEPLKILMNRACFSVFVGDIKNRRYTSDVLEVFKVLIPVEGSRIYKNIKEDNKKEYEYYFNPTDKGVEQWVNFLIKNGFPLTYSKGIVEEQEFHIIEIDCSKFTCFGGFRHLLDLIRLCYEGAYIEELDKITKLPKYVDWYLLLQLMRYFTIKNGHCPFGSINNKLITKEQLLKAMFQQKELTYQTGWSFYANINSPYGYSTLHAKSVNFIKYTEGLIKIFKKPRKTKQDKQKIEDFYEFSTKFKNLTTEQKEEFYEKNK